MCLCYAELKSSLRIYKKARVSTVKSINKAIKMSAGPPSLYPYSCCPHRLPFSALTEVDNMTASFLFIFPQPFPFLHNNDDAKSAVSNE